MQVNPQALATVQMANDEWQVVLSVLREAPYKVVAPLIEKIISQCISQSMPDANRTVDAG
jgi:hypothetical protein